MLNILLSLSKKDVILNSIQNPHSLFMLGDTGSGSGMTKSIISILSHPFGQPLGKKGGDLSGRIAREFHCSYYEFCRQHKR